MSRVTLIPVEEVAPGAVVSLEPVEEERPGLARLFGRGLVHGTLGIAESVGTGLEYLGTRTGSDTLSEIGKDTSEYWREASKPFELPEELQGSIIDNPSLLKDPAWWAYSVAEIIPSFSASILPGAGATKLISVGGKTLRLTPTVISKLARIGGAITGGLSGGALEGANTYQEVIRRGGTPEEAARAAELMTLASAGLNAISVGKALGPAKGVVGKAKHITVSALTESVTEYLEEPTEAVILGDDVIEALKQGANVIPPTLATGGLGGAAGTIRHGTSEQAAPEPVQKKENEPVRKVTLTPVEEILSEGEAAKKEYQAKRKEEAQGERTAPENVVLESVKEPSPLETEKPRGSIPVEEIWDKTPADIEEEWQKAQEYISGLEKTLQPRLDGLKKESDALKGRKDKESRTRRKELEEQAKELKGVIKEAQAAYDNRFTDDSIALREDAANRARESGLTDEETVTNFVDEFLQTIDPNNIGRFVPDENYGKTVDTVFNEVIRDFLPQERPPQDTPETEFPEKMEVPKSGLDALKERYSAESERRGYEIGQRVVIEERDGLITYGDIVEAHSTGATVSILDDKDNLLGYAKSLSWAVLDRLNKQKKPSHAGRGEKTTGENPAAFQKGDAIKSIHSGEAFEVLEPDKRGMARLKNLSTGKPEEWNAYNNPQFVRSEAPHVEKAEPKTNRKPRIVVEKARIEFTREGVRAVPIGEPEIYEPNGEKEKPGIGTIENIDTIALSSVFETEIDRGTPLNRVKVRKIVADNLGTTAAELERNKSYKHKAVEEAFEYAVVKKGRKIARSSLSGDEKFEALKRVYENQPSLNQRTSTSIAGQQYSTPLPLAWLMSEYLGIDEDTTVYEPTAGNGMLLIGTNPKKVIANELDKGYRKAHLTDGGYGLVLNEDALKVPSEYSEWQGKIDRVIMNPPFGSVEPKTYDGFRISKLEHRIAVESLKAMKDGGRAALIIGGHNFDREGKMAEADRLFFNYLYSRYNVSHNIDISGDVYRKMGTSFPIRLITIEGRKAEPDNVFAPYDRSQVEQAKDFDEARDILTGPSRAAEINTKEEDHGKDSLKRPSGEPRRGAPGETEERPGGDIEPEGHTEHPERPGTVHGKGERHSAGRGEPDTPGPRKSGSDVRDGRLPEKVEGGERVRPGESASRIPSEQPRLEQANEFQVLYRPKSKGATGKNLIPKNMVNAVASSLDEIARERDGLDGYVMRSLGYDNPEALHKALSAEQIDAVAMAVNAIENRKAVIVGDQTGVGKGRVAASVIRYANRNGMKPIFFTATPKLFSDMYRDLRDIRHRVKPFVMHNDTNTASIVDDEGKVVFKPNGSRSIYSKMVEDPLSVMNDFDAVFVPYTQVSLDNLQRKILSQLATDNIVILDESHEASGNSARGTFLREEILKRARGALYLSATYAKRPDTVPLYYRTSLGDTGMGIDELIEAVQKGGVPLQQIMANQLAETGQYIRRELNFSGIDFRTEVDVKNAARDAQKADEITAILRRIVDFDIQKSEIIKDWDKKAKKEGKKLVGKEYTSAGVNSTTFAATVHNLVGQLLMATKADNAVDLALKTLREDKKPLINLMNTMGSFIEDYIRSGGITVGEPIGFTFKDVLKKALRGTLRYQETDAYGDKAQKVINLDEMGGVIKETYLEIEREIEALETDIPASPIDYIKARIEEAGYKVGEITGRKYYIDYSKKIPTLEQRTNKEIKDRNRPVNGFNNGKIDVLIFNRAGSTGLSLHASEKFKDRRKRHMIVIQADLNIDTFIQALGRIFRKGQVVNPEYTILQTALPAEIRPAVVLTKKMASLNANTSANSESATSMKDVPDMLNSYGDKIVAEYLKNHPDINDMIGDPLDVKGKGEKDFDTTDAMQKVTGRVALLPVELQKTFYNEIEAEYRDMIEYLNQIGENNLTAKEYDFDAKTLTRKQIHKGRDESSPFTSSSYLERVSVKIQKKPFTRAKIQEKVDAALKGKTAEEFNKTLYEDILAELKEYRTSVEKKAESSPESTANALKRHLEDTREQAGYILDVLSKFKVGEVYDVAVSDDYSAKGVLIDIRQAGLEGNPVAPSKIKLIFAVADPIQTVTLPLSKKLQLRATDPLSQEFLDDWDNLAPQTSREERYIITGNLLQGFDRFGRRAEVITYTDDKGGLRHGILIPKSVKNVEEKFTTQAVDAQDAHDYLTGGGWKTVNTTNDEVAIEYSGYEADITVSKAKARGGKYYLNERLLELTAGEFYSRGNDMRASVKDKNLLEFLITLQEETGARFAIPIDEVAGAAGTGVTLDFLGLQNVYEATARLIRKLNPESAPNVEVLDKKKELGALKTYIASPSTIRGKARYYVVHAKNAVLKQDRLRDIADTKLAEIFKPLKDKGQREELEALEWMGDAEGKTYTGEELNAIGISPTVKGAYLRHRRFHNQVWRLLAAHRKAYGGDTGYLEGHVPHLFENWNVYEVAEKEVEGKEGETVEVPGGIVGTFRSLREATLFANSLSPEQKYVIRPKVFRLPDELISRTVLKDASYFRLVGRLEEGFELTREEAFEITNEIARRKNRRRFLGNLRKRTWQSGFRKDNLHDVLQQYYRSVARYIALDDFKARVVPKFEKDFGVEHGRAQNAVRDKNLALYIERYINDVNGVPGQIEEAINASIKSAPFLRQLVRSERPSIWAVNKALHATAVLKLGLFNLSAGVVNITQLTNTFSKIPSKHFTWAFKRAWHLSPREKGILRRIGVPFDIGLADTGGYSKTHKAGRLVRASMIFFQGAEHINRRITGLAAYRWARKDFGYSEKQARLFAREMIDKTQFNYSVADTPQIFRNPAGRLLGQFKPFAVKEIEFVVGLKGAENIKFWIPILLVTGLGGIPLIDGLSELIEWLTGRDPILETKAFLMRWAGDDPQRKKAAEIAMYGVGATIGVDVSRRVGLGDVLPRRAGDLLGPTINTLANAKRIMEKGDKTEFVKNLAPSVGNLLTALETALNELQVKDPWHRQRLKYQAAPVEAAVKALGFRPIHESKLSDIEQIRQYETRRYTRLQQKYIDEAIEALMAGDADRFVAAIAKAAEKGVVIDDGAIEREILQKALPEEVRTLLMTRQVQRGGQTELMDFLNAEGH